MPQTQTKPKLGTGFYLALALFSTCLIIFLEHLAIAYPEIAVGARTLLGVVYLGAPVTATAASVLAMYVGRRNHLRNVDLWAALVLPGLLVVYLAIIWMVARVIGG